MLVSCGGNGNVRQAASGDSLEVESFYSNPSKGQSENKQVKTSKNQPMEQPAKMDGVSELILKRKGYTVSYNKDTKIPNWVAWHLTKSHANGDLDRHENLFHEDYDAPMPRVTDDDYYNSGYDRGHMCPAGDNKWDKKAMNETFLFTNICPQIHDFNTGVWNDLELACRRWARQYGDLYIVCGPLLSKGQHRTIGRRKVVVPERFFKVILCMNGTPKAIGFIYDNNSRNSKKMFSHATTIDAVEKATGIDFFPKLRDEIEDVVEAERGYF